MQILAAGAATFKILGNKKSVRSIVTPRYSGIEIKPSGLLPMLVLDCHRNPCRFQRRIACLGPLCGICGNFLHCSLGCLLVFYSVDFEHNPDLAQT